MPKIKVTCKHCGREYQAGDLLPPSKSRCTKCKKRQDQDKEASVKLPRIYEKIGKVIINAYARTKVEGSNNDSRKK